MGFRFRKSIKIIPGVRLNIGKSGTSWSVGPRGLTANIKDGEVRRVTADIPGTGISYSENLTSKRSSRPSTPGGQPQNDGSWFLWLLAAVALCMVVYGLITMR